MGGVSGRVENLGSCGEQKRGEKNLRREGAGQGGDECFSGKSLEKAPLQGRDRVSLRLAAASEPPGAWEKPCVPLRPP